MGAIILFGTLMVFFSVLLVIDIKRYKNYPVTDEYWYGAIMLIIFLGSIIGMTLI